MDPDIYVNLDTIRGKDYIEEIKFNLNIGEERLQATTDNFVKIIFSGHRGSGKTVELQKFQNYIDDPARYFSVFISVEKELEVGSFQPEDFFIIWNPSSDFFQTYTLPMIPITKESIPLLKQIITKRVDSDTFIEDEALDYCIQKSGGCIRQLLRIVNKSLIISLGTKIARDIAEKSVRDLGRAMIEQFDSEHLAILRQKQYHTADPKVLDLLFSLAVLKYNGDREINPLIKDYLYEPLS